MLLIGAAGQLGRALAAEFAARYQLTEAVYREPAPGQIVVDLSEASSVMAALQATKPDVVLLAGAMCNVDLCEQEPERCRRVNVDGPRSVARWAGEAGAQVVLFSTDHVFDGARPVYGESDPVCPLNVYSRSKAEAEEVVRELVPTRHLILRTAWLYGPDSRRRNFALHLVDRVRAGEPVPVPADQWGCPTYTEDLAAATAFLVERDHGGTFHAVGPDFVDRVSLARAICDHFGLDAAFVLPRETRELGQPARRPLRVRLSAHKLEQIGVRPFRGVEAGLAALYEWAMSADS